MVVSVRRAWPSLWYCLTWTSCTSTCNEGTTPSVKTRVRNRPWRAAAPRAPLSNEALPQTGRTQDQITTCSTVRAGLRSDLQEGATTADECVDYDTKIKMSVFARTRAYEANSPSNATPRTVAVHGSDTGLSWSGMH